MAERDTHKTTLGVAFKTLTGSNAQQVFLTRETGAHLVSGINHCIDTFANTLATRKFIKNADTIAGNIISMFFQLPRYRTSSSYPKLINFIRFCADHELPYWVIFWYAEIGYLFPLVNYLGKTAVAEYQTQELSNTVPPHQRSCLLLPEWMLIHLTTACQVSSDTILRMVNQHFSDTELTSTVVGGWCQIVKSLPSLDGSNINAQTGRIELLASLLDLKDKDSLSILRHVLKALFADSAVPTNSDTPEYKVLEIFLNSLAGLSVHLVRVKLQNRVINSSRIQSPYETIDPKMNPITLQNQIWGYFMCSFSSPSFDA